MPHSILVENGSKCYRLGERQHTMLREALVGALRRLVNGKRKQPKQSVLWALNNVSFEVERGEVIGLI